MDRRTFLGTALSWLVGQCAFSCSAIAQDDGDGCLLAAGDNNPLWKKVANAMRDTTGRPHWDELFQEWLGIAPKSDEQFRRSLVYKFGVKPSIVFYDDEFSPNVFATRKEARPNGPDGTIAFGLNFLKKFEPYQTTCPHIFNNEQNLRRSDSNRKRQGLILDPTTDYSRDMAELCKSPWGIFEYLQPLLVAAHEFGHILHFKIGSPFSRQWLVEPHADFMAGWFVGNYSRTQSTKQSDLNDETLMVFAETMFNLGDTKFNNKAHHGEPAFRATMVRAGYTFADLDVRDAFQKGRQLLGN